MNRFKCPACGGNQYTACDTVDECIYCGHQKLEKDECGGRGMVPTDEGRQILEFVEKYFADKRRNSDNGLP